MNMFCILYVYIVYMSIYVHMYIYILYMYILFICVNMYDHTCIHICIYVYMLNMVLYINCIALAIGPSWALAIDPFQVAHSE